MPTSHDPFTADAFDPQPAPEPLDESPLKVYGRGAQPEPVPFEPRPSQRPPGLHGDERFTERGAEVELDEELDLGEEEDPEYTPSLAATPSAMPRDTARTWATIVHLIPIAGYLLIGTGVGLIAPLLIWQLLGQRDERIREQSLEALNFQLNLALLYLISLVTLLLVILWPLFWLVGLILPIVAAVKVSDGKRFRYPFILRFVRSS